MSGGHSLKISPEQAKEMPMVDLAYEILKAAGTPLPYRDLMREIANVKGFTEEEMLRLIAQLYTEINIDGRFACVGNNTWGLKRWYPVDRSEELGGAYPRIINDDDEEDDYYAEEETYDREDEYESLDEESEFLETDTDEAFFPGDELEEPLEGLADPDIAEEEVGGIGGALDDLGVPELEADLGDEVLDGEDGVDDEANDEADEETDVLAVDPGETDDEVEPPVEEEPPKKRSRSRK
ncbi:MAG: DNA-directed RNA polymerase subunit delta [Candidatus Reconcilbacillus cellulovorans]|uniref:Probable DNA-directed RNA polymerase subunit delta n=1 Tax=Candidatus Reconcilbacillus cellulovorans TaxID=1906605 RepID=A0A2A6E0Q8_9BACL|nr:MAG: DNA-directed RNA polymerase subunit delta [Candidatus Reconcilbacillus cellulovorans]